MKLQLFITPQSSYYREGALGEVIRSPNYRVVIRLDGPVLGAAIATQRALWSCVAAFWLTRSRATLERVWMGLHGTCARHCWPELSYLPAIFGGGG